MALIIEDGSQVASSDSYVTRTEYITYAASIGITIADEEATDNQLRKAAIFISSKESILLGDKVDRDQSMSYPRYNLYIEGFHWASDEIPTQVKKCQMELALDINNGIDLYNPPQSDSVAIKREKIDGAVEVEYAVKEAEKIARHANSLALLNLLTESIGMSIPLARR